MPRAYLPLLLLFFQLTSISQDRNHDWSAFNQNLDAAPYRGLKFRIEAAVRIEALDPAAEAELWVRVDRPNNRIGFFNNMMDKPIRSADWKVYSIEGKVDKDATRIYFGGLYHGKGSFFFDEFRFLVSKGKDEWEQVPLPDGGFETDTSVIHQHWHWARNNAFFPASITTRDAYKGTHSFLADRSHITVPETIGNSPSKGNYAGINNIRIYYEVYGAGQPLLLLHGNSSSISSFGQQIPELAKHFKVIAVDSRGQGKSTEDGKRYSYDLFAADMKALLDHLHLDSVHVVGWSDGGNTGLIMAMKYPAKVKKLVTMGANIFINDQVVEKWIFKTLHKEKKELLADPGPRSANRLRLIELLLTEPHHRFEELQGIQCPVLIMAGEKDVIKEGHTRGMAKAISGSTLMIVPGGTHYFPSEKPAEFNKAVLDFLSKTP